MAAAKVTGHSLWLTDAHKEDLQFLQQLPGSVVGEFARLAIEFLRQGPNEKFFKQAARKLKVAAAVVEDGLNALGFLMLEAARVGLGDAQMMVDALSINDLGFDDEGKASIAQQYAANVPELRKIISGQRLTTPHYKDLEWRLDVQVASRSLRQLVEPTYKLKLRTQAKGIGAKEEEPVVMEADYASLKHLTTELASALQEANSYHQRRLARYIK